MAKEESVSVKDTVYKLQLSLLEGIENEDQLLAAGSLMSRSDYEDVVVERSIANLCGYPLCNNSLPSDRPYKGRYRISLKEHRVYDLQETYMYCSSSCLVNSRAFSESLQEKRCSVLNPIKLNEILRKFNDLTLDSEGLGRSGDLGLSNLKIQEKSETNVGKVSLEEWIGPSNAIEGYVPQGDRDPNPSLKNHKEGLKAICKKPVSKQDCFFSDTDFTSTIITNDEYSISKGPSGLTSTASDIKLQAQTGKGHEGLNAQLSSLRKQDSIKASRKSKGRRKEKVIKEQLNFQDLPSSSYYTAEAEDISQATGAANLNESVLKPSLKSSGAKRSNRSVTWADERVDNAGSRNLCEVQEMEQTNESHEISESANKGDDGHMLRFESAEACAVALSQAAEAVASGDADVNKAMSEAGIIVLPPSQDLGQGGNVEKNDMIEQESASLKWPTKPGIPQSDLFDPEDSWYDAPPEGFSLTLSPFATMWMALFAWVTSSSLAYIYGRDESAHEDYLSVNGREYPRKIVLRDGRSSEIRLTAESCLARTFPGLVANLRLPIPVSTLEQGAGRLLETMSFVDALPAFRTKQWQVIALLFIEALSVCRIPALTSYMTSRRMVLHQVLDGAHISAEEYDIMKDFMVPLGRDPQARSGA
ncbi:putative RNA polymerase II subunit B1 CTD phosphatase RPAP2 homolog [Ricinus communis]|uniref:putative RNA polymerase II subunit B1 CTD phosphatase RPAP2 homolog n=1 Tax=Ricinus communis TaxID=3988 RepID=UPI00201A236A|nr:putative RNA polymerase II subunit B1 CTD phosphatase RPAP2 homolog [Ricinus communis]XP_015576516.2 putative RNA polymerase II subunit B1 CTD phosphatase RPAP2 homolog [Ricinus communis]XP_048232096.1 putative RNA polymerase II subunit B1 CTD phosphatase RPAP2 homolog [Ricinus communis]XP_048232103.1 putative RNA polymerase II subunit B1 CTD phosphatase RPAP2 homolog [Ricinus communis]